MIISFAVYEVVFPAAISSSGTLSTAMSSIATISTTGDYSHTSGCSSDIIH